MPLSIEEATKRYKSQSENIQDLILIMESYMGKVTSFSFDLQQAIGNLGTVDVTKEENNITSYIKALEEYRKIINCEKKRRSLHKIIEGKVKVDNLKANLKLQRRSQRLGFTNPYQQPPPLQPQKSSNDEMLPVQVIEH